MEENINPTGPENTGTNPTTPPTGSNIGSQTFGSRIDMSELWQAVRDIEGQISKVIVGQTDMIELIIAGVLADGHLLLEGVPGVAKTLTAKLVAKTIDVDFSRVQFTPDLMPSDVLGTSIFNVKTSEFEFKSGPIFSNIVLIDEINRSPAKTQAALFEVMEERQVTIDGARHQMAPPFIVIGTQNPVEQEGTYRLPEAQLDRFMFKIEVGYPSAEEETEILIRLNDRKGKEAIEAIKPILSAEKLTQYREQIKNIHIDRNLIVYIARLIDQTRNNSSLFLGASPRASIALMTGAKAIAAMRGRDFVTPEDIKFLATPVLAHRIAPTPEKEMEGVSARDIVDELIERVDIPR